jgi:hypothetical protein
VRAAALYDQGITGLAKLREAVQSGRVSLSAAETIGLKHVQDFAVGRRAHSPCLPFLQGESASFMGLRVSSIALSTRRTLVHQARTTKKVD